MLDLVSKDRLANILRVMLALKFGGVNPDYDELIRKRVLELLKLRKYMHAVDATEGPEIQEHEASAKLGHRVRRCRVHPYRAFQRRRWNPLGIRITRNISRRRTNCLACTRLRA